MSQILVWITSKLMGAKLIQDPLVKKKKKKKNYLFLHNPVNKYINVSINKVFLQRSYLPSAECSLSCREGLTDSGFCGDQERG